eukprot:3340365-Lingulodinium_polyedra.AAC.1
MATDLDVEGVVAQADADCHKLPEVWRTVISHAQARCVRPGRAGRAPASHRRLCRRCRVRRSSVWSDGA